MLYQPKEIRVNELLTWESARLDDYVKDLECNPPVKTINYLPAWFRNLKNNLQDYTADHDRYNNTARACIGLRSLLQNSYTIAMPVEYQGEQNVICRKIFHPEMLHGTYFAEKHNSEYEWDFTLIAFPWRARLHKDYILQVQEHGIVWNKDLKVFTAQIPANHNFNAEKNGFGNLYSWEIEPDTEKFNYCNIEVVIAHKKTFQLKTNDAFFSISIVKK